MKSAIKIVIAVVLSTFALQVAAQSSAQQYPSRPVRVIVPFAAAGPTDFVARIVAQKLSEAWGQQFIVDNRSGAGGNIGMGIAAAAAGNNTTARAIQGARKIKPAPAAATESPANW